MILHTHEHGTQRLTISEVSTTFRAISGTASCTVENKLPPLTLWASSVKLY